jgi:hypothetical protein
MRRPRVPDPAPPRGRSGLAAPIANALATGVLLGTLQWAVFFLLRSYLASTAVVYLLATCVWLLGSLLGMTVPGRREVLWLGGAIACFYAFRALAMAHPWALSWLPPLLVLVAGMGAYAGRFFRCRAGVFQSTKWLFFLENTGFVAGMAMTAIALYWTGDAYFGIAPLVAGAAVLATGAPFMLRRRYHQPSPGASGG